MRKKISFVVALVMLFSTFAVFTPSSSVEANGFGDYPPPASGNWVIDSDTTVWDETIIVNGSLIISETAKLTLIRCTLKINSTFDGQYKIRVNSTGEFYVYNSTITAYNTAYKYRFEVYGRLWTNHSTIEYMWGDENNPPYTGGIQIYGAGAEVWLNHTKVTRSGGNGIHAENVVGMNITGDSNITGNTRAELYALNCKYFNLTYSNFTDYIDARVSNGVWFDDSEYITVDHCYIAHHVGDGLYLWNVSSSVVSYNDIGVGAGFNNAGSGITVRDCDTTVRIKWNNISENAEGINYRTKSSPIIENNHIYENNGGIGNGNSPEIYYCEFYIYNNTIENNTGSGIWMHTSNATIINNTLWGDNIEMYNSYARIEDCFIRSGNAIWSNGSSPFVVNTTIVAGDFGRCFSIENDSHPFALNCTVDYWDHMIVQDTSNVTVQNYLDVGVLDSDGFTPIPDAWANVTDDGTQAYSRQTDVNGEAQWLVVTNRTYLQDFWTIAHPFTNISYNQTVVEVEKGTIVFGNNPRVIGMDTSHWEVFQATDTTAPRIKHAPISSADINQPINITTNITDDSGVDAVYLNFTGVNATIFNVSMSQWNGNWSYDIPGQDTLGFIDYFIWCNDTLGYDNRTIIYHTQIIEEITPAQIEPDSVALPIYPKWNIISVPLEPLDKGSDGIFTAHDFLQEVESDLGPGIYTLAKFDGGNPAHYTVFTSGDLEGAANDFKMNNVDAYWLYSPGLSGMVNIPGQNITNWGVGNVKTLQPGWNLCGFPHNISVGGGEPGGWNTQLQAHHFTDGTVDADLKVGVADEEQIIATRWIPKYQTYQSWTVTTTQPGYAPNDWAYDSYYSGGYWLWVNNSIEITFDTEF